MTHGWASPHMALTTARGRPDEPRRRMVRRRKPTGSIGNATREPNPHVKPVTRGQRLGAFFWVQSMVRDDGCRTLLFDLDMAVQTLSRDVPDHPSGVQLTGIYHNLLRRWAEV